MKLKSTGITHIYSTGVPMAKPDAIQYDKDGNEMAHWRFNQTPLKQEPVAFRNTETGEFCTGGFLRKDWAKWQPLYTEPVHAIDMSEKHIQISDKDRHEKGACQEKRQVAMRRTTRDEKIVNPGVYEVPEFDCPRCGHCCPEREWIGLDKEMMRNTTLEFNRGALWAERYLKEKNT